MSRSSAIRFDAAADRILLPSGIFDTTQPYALVFSAYFTSDTGDYSDIWSANTNATDGTQDEEVAADFTGANNRWSCWAETTGGATEVTAGTVATGRWYDIAIVRETMSSLRLYVDGVLMLTQTKNVSGRTTPTRLELGGWTSSNLSRLDGRISNLRVWQAALTAAEVQAERGASAPVRRRDLRGWYPLRPGSQRLLDASGYGRHLTSAGTLTDEAGPPLLAPASRRSMVKVSAASSITGTLAATLDAVTLAASGALPIAGTAAPTLGALQSAGTGALSLAGTASATLGALTSSAAGTLALAGSLSATLADVTVSAAGSGAHTGTLAQTLGALQSSAAGTLALVGTLSATLGAVTASGAGALGVAGSLSATLAPLTASGVGSAGAQGSLSATLAAVTSSAAGTLALVGTLSATLGALSSTGAGAVRITGTLGATLGAATLSGVGSAGAQGSLFATLAALQGSAAGTLALAGSLSATLEAATLSGAGALALAGSLSATLAPVALSGAGSGGGGVALTPAHRVRVPAADRAFAVPGERSFLVPAADRAVRVPEDD